MVFAVTYACFLNREKAFVMFLGENLLLFLKPERKAKNIYEAVFNKVSFKKSCWDSFQQDFIFETKELFIFL
ncbi:MAG: hypothetical protein CO003_00165 [Candidatus Portnoybacteria bacterium CG_4_8_14_3_um_filter_44_15]|uniref:Uncharacterized protein n=4 Tax=Candidatus Portnoyibacteriota TaxID=1817913 RepID=A0A2M7YMB1_9BACT|nr:MAG: hypothetical protein COX45_00530 [Candidatus Portnoybacteria bacterium CG23_combo_of_CG06-09_8_20_14_all_44_36]PIW74913.1 MAG: hypothetical protein CO003_00165 [Candidatus Portnoybacteria bacterium CG_4_8_14_3_um_filter_44_15]PIZ70095.1 MAG: hypothetical protein COY10_00365 [Candidatus Portnoybacteria bacterium CG_4_10_14_0_2_um_filter_43_36]PJA64133.1 MAG: hypothetical protein CO160_00350 [Candidatus Portnoybacteria bacterium CG_4_9_14_3_um_filter_43_11]PJE59400.1 MAG: hypothetical pro